MRRREFIAGIAGAAVCPPAARAQQGERPVVGWVSTYAPDNFGRYVAAGMRKGLNELGYVEGGNLAIEYRWAYGQYDRLPALVADLIRHRAAIIAATGGGPSALAAKAATSTIPIIFNVAADPVRLGLVPSLSRPGGNITGITSMNTELVPKRMELLHELLPPTATMAVLTNPAGTDAGKFSREIEAAGRTLGRQLLFLNAGAERDFDAVFETLRAQRAPALVIGSDPLFNSHSEQLAVLSLRYSVPAIYQFRPFVAAGGLMSYGADVAEIYRLVGNYIGRVLKGDKPADLAVQQSTKIALIINLKSAKALGLTIPETRLATADEVIE